MEKTKLMIEREKRANVIWKDEGGGYFSGQGTVFASVFASYIARVCYIALPEGHPDTNKKYDDLDPDVNGGLTFSEENIFGWDYSHYRNPGTPSTDIKNALKYFRKRA